jgi:hypothetical protein
MGDDCTDNYGQSIMVLAIMEVKTNYILPRIDNNKIITMEYHTHKHINYNIYLYTHTHT